MKNNNISNKELDQLLSQSFLNLDFTHPKNTRLLESVSNYTFSHKSTKNTFSNKSAVLKFILFLSLAGIALIGYLFSLKKEHRKPQKSYIIVADKQDSKDSVKIIVQESTVKKWHSIKVPYIDTEIKRSPTNPESQSIETKESRSEVMVYKEISEPGTIHLEETVYTFPKLTEKEIRETAKEKKRMIKFATRISKEKFVRLPGKHLIMQVTEVSNLEYRTFLFDLLIQDRKEDFIKAKPDQKLWISANGTSKFDNYKDQYFSEARFNDCPVVNISPEGAIMYCKWLSESVANNTKAKGKIKPEMEFRLPDENEWIFAAQGGIVNASYPWGRDSIQNSKNRFLANFCIQKLKDKFNQPIVYPTKTDPNAYTSAGFALNLDSVSIVNVSAYNPNNYYLYCMSGNVSEMVYETGSDQIKTKGGNWASDFEHLKIKSEDEFKGASKISPMIGFRIVCTVE